MSSIEATDALPEAKQVFPVEETPSKIKDWEEFQRVQLEAQQWQEQNMAKQEEGIKMLEEEEKLKHQMQEELEKYTKAIKEKKSGCAISDLSIQEIKAKYNSMEILHKQYKEKAIVLEREYSAEVEKMREKHIVLSAEFKRLIKETKEAYASKLKDQEYLLLPKNLNCICTDDQLPKAYVYELQDPELFVHYLYVQKMEFIGELLKFKEEIPSRPSVNLLVEDCVNWLENITTLKKTMGCKNQRKMVKYICSTKGMFHKTPGVHLVSKPTSDPGGFDTITLVMRSSEHLKRYDMELCKKMQLHINKSQDADYRRYQTTKITRLRNLLTKHPTKNIIVKDPDFSNVAFLTLHADHWVYQVINKKKLTKALESVISKMKTLPASHETNVQLANAYTIRSDVNNDSILVADRYGNILSGLPGGELKQSPEYLINQRTRLVEVELENDAQLRKNRKEKKVKLAKEAANDARASISQPIEESLPSLPAPIDCKICQKQIQPREDVYYKYSCKKPSGDLACSSFPTHKDCLEKHFEWKHRKQWKLCPSESCDNSLAFVNKINKDGVESVHTKSKKAQPTSQKGRKSSEPKVEQIPEGNVLSTETSPVPEPDEYTHFEVSASISPPPPFPGTLSPVLSASSGSENAVLTVLPLDRKTITLENYRERKKDETEDKYMVEDAVDKIRRKKQNRKQQPVSWDEFVAKKPIVRPKNEVENDKVLLYSIEEVSDVFPGTPGSEAFEQKILETIGTIIDDIPANLPTYKHGETHSVAKLMWILMRMGEKMLSGSQIHYLTKLSAVSSDQGETLKNFVNGLRYYKLSYNNSVQEWRFYLNDQGKGLQNMAGTLSKG